MLVAKDRNGAGLFLGQSHFPDPCEPQETYIRYGSATEFEPTARRITFVLDKETCKLLIDNLTSIYENEMVLSTAKVKEREEI